MKVFQRFSRGEAAPVRKISSLNHPRYRGPRGATAIEYGVIVALIAAALFFVFGASEDGGGALADMLDTLMKNVKTALGITE